jgi:hypothetical protein
MAQKRPARRRIRLSTRNSDIIEGRDNFDDWDDEELLRGRRRDRNGGWGGRPPSVVPARVHHEVVKRNITAAQALFTVSIERAVEICRELMDGADVKDETRLKAAQLVIERVMGKQPDVVAVTVTDKPYQALMGKAFTDRDVMDADSWEVEEDGSEGSPPQEAA